MQAQSTFMKIMFINKRGSTFPLLRRTIGVSLALMRNRRDGMIVGFMITYTISANHH